MNHITDRSKRALDLLTELARGDLALVRVALTRYGETSIDAVIDYITKHRRSAIPIARARTAMPAITSVSQDRYVRYHCHRSMRSTRLRTRFSPIVPNQRASQRDPESAERRNSEGRRQMLRKDDAVTAALAGAAAMRECLRNVPEAQKRSTANRAMAIAMGILHDCCGPNGDFTSEPRRQKPTETA